MELLLKVSGLVTEYDKVPALKNVTIHVERKELVSIIGSNGAGKSTLLKSICGWVQPSSGEIIFDGSRIDRLPAHEIVKRGIAYCPEGRRVFPYLTVLENLQMGAYARKGKDWLNDLDKVFQRFPKLRERRKQLASSLSGGEQQMLAIGRALMSAPQMLLFDEPSLGLAPVVVDEVQDVIADLRREGVTMLLVEQNAFLAMKLADRCYVLEMGEVILSGKSTELLENEQVRTAYLGI